MNRWPLSTVRLVIVLVAASITISQTGCGVVGLMAQVSYWIYGDKIAPQTHCLEKKRVAVVCLDPGSLKGPGNEAAALAKAISNALAYNVEGIDVVRQQEINDWIDTHDDDLTDFRDVGRGVKAEMVVGVDLESFTLHEGQTLLKGRANVAVKVFDMTQNGKVVYETPSREIAFPKNGARHVTESEANFRTIFLHTLAQKVARDFYAYDRLEDYGGDSALLE
jgi:hypothetical protein